MRNTLSLIAPQNQSQQASTVFEYMQEAIRSSQETEALLLAQTEEQRVLPVSYTHLDVYKRQGCLPACMP